MRIIIVGLTFPKSRAPFAGRRGPPAIIVGPVIYYTDDNGGGGCDGDYPRISE